MSIAMIQSFKATGIKPTERLVAYMLADHHNDGTGRCDPSVSLLVEETGLDSRSVTRAIQRLEEAGHITVLRIPGNRNAYRLHPQDLSNSQSHPRHKVTPPPAESHPRHKVTPVTESGLPPAESRDYPRHKVTPPPAESHPNRNEPETKPEFKPEVVAKKQSRREVIDSEIQEARMEPIPLDLNTTDFRESWDHWNDHRAALARQSNKPWTARAAKMTLNECSRYGADIAVMAITAAIGRGWQGLVWDRLQPIASAPREAPKSFAQQDKERREAERHGSEVIVPKIIYSATS